MVIRPSGMVIRPSGMVIRPSGSAIALTIKVFYSIKELIS